MSEEYRADCRLRQKPVAVNEAQPTCQRKRQLPRLGRLRFRTLHGTVGLVSWPVVFLTLCLTKRQASAPLVFGDGANEAQQAAAATTLENFFVALSILSAAALALSAVPLLRQVPRQTVISTRFCIIPPHKEAFQRTIATVGYLNLRLAKELLERLSSTPHFFPNMGLAIFSPSSFWWQAVFGWGLLAYYLYFFTPKVGSFGNGNTWVFVVPMFLGFGVDVYHQQIDATAFKNQGQGGNFWNSNVVTVEYLLTTLLSAETVAFMFTLGFRNIVPIKYGYWIAALIVLLLCWGMWMNFVKATVG